MQRNFGLVITIRFVTSLSRSRIFHQRSDVNSYAVRMFPRPSSRLCLHGAVSRCR
jgi:hypothetical protein